MSRRVWRLARGLGHNLGDNLRGRGRGDRRELDGAELEARAEVDAHGQRPAAARSGLPSPSEAPPRRAGDLGSLPMGEGQAAARETPEPPVLAPQIGTADPALTPHYVALGLPVGASIREVEHRYRHLKEECRPERFAGDPVARAQARQREARLDEAYHALRQALVRERRL
ncbi:MAG: J domain-containing protein [Armatimonadetes bacterium]|nr:J domain-containing protein [Armatimonadota bacterium]